jgi:hypothetical protein
MAALKSMFYVLTLSCILVMFVNPSLGISVSYRADGASSSSNYHLDKSTALKDVGTLGEGTISRTNQVSGSGYNEYSYGTSATGSSAGSAVKSSGVLSATTSTIASGGVAVLDQCANGNGDLVATVSGSSDTITAGQSAGVANGALSTSQSLAANGEVVIAGQNTQMTGDVGSILSTATGQENHMDVFGEGDATDAITAKLQAIADSEASVAGYVSSGNDVVLGREAIEQVASESGSGLQVSRDYDALGVIANFGAMAINAAAASAVIPPSNDVATGGYKYSGYKWSGTNPLVKMIVDTSNKGNGITGADFGTAMYNAASTWNSARSGLFGSFQSGVVGNTAIKNGKNEIGWSTTLASNTLGMTSCWSSKGWAIEADVMVNRNLQWTKNARSDPKISPYDAQALGLHELGHVLGLADLSKDNNEIMRQSVYRATKVGRTLGTGDKNGIKKLYLNNW